MQTTTVKTYLALGDSYTIGEAVPLHESFPHQTVALLRQQGIAVAAPEFVAKTGWTTFELEAAMQQVHFLPAYSFVSLLIGVNNQYRGLPVLPYRKEFTVLLERAIQLAGGNAAHVAVLSIPDYGATPFAKTKDHQKISNEINLFNKAALEICTQKKVAFINTTEDSRDVLHDPLLVASDALHPSGKEYRKWAEKLAAWAAPLLCSQA